MKLRLVFASEQFTAELADTPTPAFRKIDDFARLKKVKAGEKGRVEKA